MKEIWCHVNEAPKKDTEVSLAELCMKHRKEGMKVVVNCLINDFHFRPEPGCEHDRMWKAKLREWGLDEN